ncbi:MAG: hypothetical protein AAFQ15_05055 [Pseudomonadota bacterium]
MLDPQDVVELDAHDRLLIDVAQHLQLTQTEHRNNAARYRALSNFIDAPGSVLHNRVVDVFPSGSNAIDAAIRGLIIRDTPDVDAVIVLDIPSWESPKRVIELVVQAITRGGDDNTTYRECKVIKNSRCVTVVYADGSTVDLMPVILLREDAFAPVMQLFHFKDDVNPAESYVKLISPVGFKNAVERALKNELGSRLYGNLSEAMRGTHNWIVSKADVEAFPDQTQFQEKSPRIVILQLLKRFRDIQFRSLDRKGRRKPPSVILATLAIEAPFARHESFTDELIFVARYIKARLDDAMRSGIVVRNPGYPDDIFSDRWPEIGTNDQLLLSNDLQLLINALLDLKTAQKISTRERILKVLFGEEVAKDALRSSASHIESARKAGRLAIASSGAAVVSHNAGRSTVSTSERFGGDLSASDQ